MSGAGDSVHQHPELVLEMAMTAMMQVQHRKQLAVVQADEQR
jgi:hypothetical protein